MYTILKNCGDGECIYNLVERTEANPEAPPMYRSRYSCFVRQEAVCNKTGCHRTMGLPKTGLCPPQNFLKKNSRAPISIRPPGVPTVQLVCKPSQTNTRLDNERGGGDADSSSSTQDGGCATEEPQVMVCASNSSQDGGCATEEPQVMVCALGDADNSSSTQAGGCATEEPQVMVCALGDADNSSSTQAGGCATEEPQVMACAPRCRVPRICCNVKKPPVPSPCCGFGIIPKGCKDYVCDNALKITRQPAKIAAARYVDTAKGDVHDWCPSGYPRKFVYKEDYGMIPGYLVERNKSIIERENAMKCEMERKDREAQNTCRHMTEEDRANLICGLKTNWDETLKDYQSLPLMIDTEGKVKKKAELEASLKSLENDIQLLQRHNHIFLANSEKSFYLA